MVFVSVLGPKPPPGARKALPDATETEKQNLYPSCLSVAHSPLVEDPSPHVCLPTANMSPSYIPGFGHNRFWESMGAEPCPGPPTSPEGHVSPQIPMFSPVYPSPTKPRWEFRDRPPQDQEAWNKCCQAGNKVGSPKALGGFWAQRGLLVGSFLIEGLSETSQNVPLWQEGLEKEVGRGARGNPRDGVKDASSAMSYCLQRPAL